MKKLATILLLFLLISTSCGTREPKQEGSMSAADFTLSSLDGETITLSELKGQVVLVDFWATWCPPCKNSIPHLIDLYERYKDRGFIILGISLEDQATLEKFVAEYDITYPILLGTRDIAQTYGVQAIPKSVFIDRKGTIRKVQTGFSPELAPVFESLVDSLLKE